MTHTKSEIDADAIREHCRQHYVEPARERGDLVVGIRAGDVHAALSLSQRYGAVCSAIGAELFERHARVKRIAIEGPVNGGNTLFVYRIL